MITKEQKIWLEHLSNSERIKILPYDSKTKETFRAIKEELIRALGKIKIIHRGSTALEIAGQGEVDLYIPVSKKDFNRKLEKLKKHLGEPRSAYPLKRVRFVKYIDAIKIEIFLINKNDQDWKNSVRFEKYLKRNPEILRKYEKIKVKADGLSIRRYYEAKIRFINKVLSTPR